MLKEKYPSTEDTRLILQNNLKAIREILNWTSSDLGNLIGVTKQTISNLETQNSRLTKLHYIALRTVIDFEQISEASSLIATTSTVKNAATVIGSLAAIIGAPVVAALMNSKDKK